MTWTIAALYRFVSIADPAALRSALLDLCTRERVVGTILIATEGVNGTIAGPAEGIEAVLDHLDRDLAIRLGEVKFSEAAERPFARLRIRVRPEIITMRAPEADPTRLVGTYVEPADWNALIRDPDTLVLDTRNGYETRVGTFAGAVDPGIDTFTEFKDFAERELDPARHRRIAMFCTGGIRCEKASSYLLASGFEDVRHLRGGILKYLETVPPEQSLWEGDCYVFDNRTAVGASVRPANWTACFGCGSPLSAEEREDTRFEEGVSCPHCAPHLTEERRSSLRQRHLQMMSAQTLKTNAG
ncbi:rhodanese-related sulfurtransferase [Aureimonas flava]|uniref:tRNA uridine(34) hydroxylase n=1 Tax=Aureimonas flava TaxID=2320271 RepID=A0A3A1WRV5_9HYPH|nr:rhodanese-related sulfurtransferase [Aureimonas flava]RIY03415.1 rhodanese-related sulfurtransferase [Aureimonas flava]